MLERMKHRFKCWSRNFTLLFLILFSLLLMPFESSVELRCQDIYIYIYIWDQYHHSAYKTGGFVSCFLISLLNSSVEDCRCIFFNFPSLKHVVHCFETILKDQKWKNKKVPLFLEGKLFHLWTAAKITEYSLYRMGIVRGICKCLKE